MEDNSINNRNVGNFRASTSTTTLSLVTQMKGVITMSMSTKSYEIFPLKSSSFNLITLKKWVKKNYPADHPLQIIQEEKDIIESKEEFLSKVEIWLKLKDLKR